MKIILVGKADLQTELLLNLLRSQVTPDCQLQGADPLPAVPGAEALYILDLALLDVEPCSALLHRLHARGAARAALINVGPAIDQARLAALPGVRGLFPPEASAEQFLRGIQAIVEGEYWLPRHVLCSHLENTRQRGPAVAAAAPPVKLSPKERQLLALLSQGCSNEVIASRLAISPHTVKTHFYNLYRKLQVRNRVQAATWAQQHIEALEMAT